jgi:hypothetical protein
LQIVQSQPEFQICEREDVPASHHRGKRSPLCVGYIALARQCIARATRAPKDGRADADLEKPMLSGDSLHHHPETLAG